MCNYNNIKELLHNRSICIVIPTYNNAGTVEGVVVECTHLCEDVIVVNDGSTDETKQILSNIPNIVLINNESNRGKGYALKQGFSKALELGFSYAITIDSDGQHFPHNIQDFLKANQQYPGSLIIGTRDLNDVVRSSGSSFANKFSNFWFCIQTWKKAPDTQSGYRLYPLKKLHGLKFITSRYEAELEFLVFAVWHGVDLKSIPINVFYPAKDARVSHFRPVKDFLRISILNTILCILAVFYGIPKVILRKCIQIARTIFSALFCAIVIMCVITPSVWIYSKVKKMTPARCWNIHRLIYWCARRLMLNIGIPGTTFKYSVPQNETFEKPSLIICNHQSHFDLMCLLIFTPRIIFLTNDWVWKNPVYGAVIRNAEYYPTTLGIDQLLPKLQSLVERGFHIAVFPEGTRSEDCHIQRFHKGAFHIAQALKLDILPMYLYGTGKVLPKHHYILHKGNMYLEVGKRIMPSEMQLVGDIQSQASYMRKQYQNKYQELCNILDQDA